jgi:inosine-uridine nucleoside N-ribohydrolase
MSPSESGAVISKMSAALCLTVALMSCPAARAKDIRGPAKVIIDTDIGDDIDDAFAVALALRSPELDILGISTDYGDTAARAKILDRMLAEVGRQDIPVAVGSPTPIDASAQWIALSQGRYGETGHFASRVHPAAIDLMLEQIRRYPGEITLVTLGPMPNIGALIDKSPDTFRQLRRIVMMGGAIEPIKPDFGDAPPLVPAPEWNIMLDIPAARKVFETGVPLYVMPLDSTAHLKLQEVNRNLIFSQGTPLTDALTLLYHQWSNRFNSVTPVLYDAMPIAFLLDPELCPVKPMRIRVDEKGLTRPEPGMANAQVCLRSDATKFFELYMSRLLGTRSQ